MVTTAKTSNVYWNVQCEGFWVYMNLSMSCFEVGKSENK